MGRCGPGDVLVCDAMRQSGAANIGDVKAIHLKMQKAEGMVTDGAIRDLAAVRTYGFKNVCSRSNRDGYSRCYDRIR